MITMKSLRILLTAAFATSPLYASSIVYEGEAGPGLGKHIVFLASDEARFLNAEVLRLDGGASETSL